MIQPAVRQADCDKGGAVQPVLVRKYSLDLLVSKARRRDRVEGDMSRSDAVAVRRSLGNWVFLAGCWLLIRRRCRSLGNWVFLAGCWLLIRRRCRSLGN